jgi:hypothetical protein
LRKARILAVALIAALGISAVAIAQSTAENEYTVNGAIKPTGGTKKKPKPIQLQFGFTNSRPDNTLPAPIKKYSIGFEGAVANTKAVKAKCTAAAMNAAESDAGCPKKARVGSGTIDSLIWTTGQAITDEAIKCKLALTLYNGGSGHMPLWLKTGAPDCVTNINQAIDAKFVKKSGGVTALEFEVPDELRHQLNLDIAVMKVTSKINRIVGKVGKKKVGFFSSVGCKDKKRDIAVTFTDENGVAKTAKKTLPKC